MEDRPGIKVHPDKIARAESFEVLQERYKGKLEMTELAQVAKRLYEELEVGYGIIVPASFFVGKDEEGRDAICSTVDWIDGKNLQDIEGFAELAPAVEALYSSIARYLFDKSRSGDFYLCDINSQSQYVYGRKTGEEESKIYLVDTDVYVNNSRVGLSLVMEWLARHMSGAEREFGVKFEEARGYLEKFIDQSLSVEIVDSKKEIVEKHVGEIRKFLNGEMFGLAPKSGLPTFE